MNSSSTSSANEQPVLGMVFMLSAMMLLPIMDGLAKFLGADLDAAEIAFWRFFSQNILLILPIFYLKIWFFNKEHILWQLLPGIFIAAATTFFFHALQHMSMAKTITIFFVSPLILTILSAIFLREALRVRRIFCLIIGFIGVLIVMRPENFSFAWYTLLPLCSALLFAIYMLLLRRISKLCHPFMSQWYVALGAIGFLSILLALPQLGINPFSMTFQGPEVKHLPYLLGIGIIAISGHSLLVSATAKAPANLLAPLSYAELVSAAIIGYLAFGEIPDRFTVIGGSLIVCSGLYLIYREHQLHLKNNNTTR